MITRRAAGAVALLAALAGPAAAEPHWTTSDERTFVTPGPQSAALYISRELMVRASPMGPERLYLDGKPFELLPQRSYLADTLAPGVHCLAGVQGLPSICLDFKPGRTYALRLREEIDDMDHLKQTWMLDDPTAFRAIVTQNELPLVSISRRGIANLQAWIEKRGAIRDSGAVLNAAAAHPPALFDHVLYENPATPTRPDDRTRGRTGKLEVDARNLSYTRDDRMLVVPLDSIQTVRYGGIRYPGTNPWLDVQYSSDTGTQIASFADLRPEQAFDSYNRMFAVITDLWAESPGSSATGLFLSPIVPPDR